eukprot:Anaeramoba_flamelloidesa1866_95.p1 GENE.a1866_95~~a1866_95.p1  ORF type:complete len:293 (+),score=68.44 a1866_95:37-879(+)
MSGSSSYSKVMVNISCSDLVSLDKFSQSDPIAVLLEIDPNTHKAVEIGRTEWKKNDKNPSFAKSFSLEYRFETTQIYKICVYDFDGKSNHSSSFEFIGEISFSLGELMGGRGMSLSKHLFNRKKPKRKNGICTVVGEECDKQASLIKMKLQGIKLEKKDFFGKSDPFLTFYRKQVEGEGWIKVHTTEVKKGTLYPKWKPFTLTTTLLCGNDQGRAIKLEVLDWNKSGKPDLIGNTIVTLQEIMDSKNKKFDIIEPRKKRKKKKKKKKKLKKLKKRRKKKT